MFFSSYAQYQLHTPSVWFCVYEWTHTVVAAPAGGGVGCFSHLLQGFSAQVAHLPQTAIMEDPCARPAGEQIISRPNLTHFTHLIVHGLIAKQQDTKQINQSLLSNETDIKNALKYSNAQQYANNILNLFPGSYIKTY